MRSLSSGLMVLIGAGIALAGSVGGADARGAGGAGIAGGARGGFAAAPRGAGFGGRNASFGPRFAVGGRFGHGGYAFGRGRYGYGYGFGAFGGAFGGYGYGYGYGAPDMGSLAGYDPGPPTSIGIPASPVAPPAIYVIGEPSRTKASGTSVRGRPATRKLAARGSDVRGESRVAAGGPRIIRVSR